MNLSQLIDAHRGGRSYTELERDCGGAPTSKRLQQLVRQPMKNFPDPPTVVALAKGLRVSQTAVILAAAESLGLDVGSMMPRVVELMPAGARDLTEQQAAAIAHLVRTIVDASPSIDIEPSAYERTPGPEPTVKEVLAAREVEAERRQLRAVAHEGDVEDAEKVDNLARRARERDSGPSKD